VGMGSDTRVVVIATESGDNRALIDRSEVPFHYEKGDLGTLHWVWEGFEYMPHILVRWDKGGNSLRKIWFGHVKPVGIEKECQRVMIDFDGGTRR
jgi:hypothetical protein